MSVEEINTGQRLPKQPRRYGRPKRTAPRTTFDCLDRRVLEKNGPTYTLDHKMRHGDQVPSDKRSSHHCDSDDDDIFVTPMGYYKVADSPIRNEQQMSTVGGGDTQHFHRWANMGGIASINDGSCVHYATTPLGSRYASMQTPRESNEISPILSPTYAGSIMSRFSFADRHGSIASTGTSPPRPSSQAGSVSFRSVTF